MFQNVFDCAALIALSTTTAVFVALAVISNEVSAPNVAQADLFQVTVIHKNRLHPRMGDIQARAAQTDSKGEANSVWEIAFGRQGQWI